MKKQSKATSPVTVLTVAVPLMMAMASLIMATVYIVYRMAANKAHEEKWKDYIDCGLA